MISVALLLPLARMINAGQIDPENLTRESFFDVLKSITGANEPIEIYVTRLAEEMRLIEHCLREGEAKSSVVLLFTFLEGEVNTLLRVHLRVHGFSANAITDALRGTDFDTKLNVLLPLLGVPVSDRIRNAALQCKAIRNLVVHNKATPGELSGKKGDAEVASARAERFFLDNPIVRIKKDLSDFVNEGVFENDDVQWAAHLFRKYYESDDG